MVRQASRSSSKVNIRETLSHRYWPYFHLLLLLPVTCFLNEMQPPWIHSLREEGGNSCLSPFLKPAWAKRQQLNPKLAKSPGKKVYKTTVVDGWTGGQRKLRAESLPPSLYELSYSSSSCLLSPSTTEIFSRRRGFFCGRIKWPRGSGGIRYTSFRLFFLFQQNSA